ncbi:MAG TPA: helix-turn-helix domain-containing protein [Candidatus Acutalibacter pullistercoris]|uniref:Helix-turn-helix domain-containing protein n=1 Tax=Candidatus Acutalibacter pullistercoris TaxID=2838418 RepID=A0A9D1YBH4_9FIRM|nr:helix-turn-helix domain-containing protein [Candidatus Acutalibacter pullistercoris]
MSSLGQSLTRARKKQGLTQEQVGEKLGVSRQTISKWELDETLPDIRQAKELSRLYGTTLDDLIDYDAEVEEVKRVVRHTSQETQEKIDWSKLWGEMYPVLNTYPQQVEAARYTGPLEGLLQDLRETYGYSPLDAFLVLKDLLGKLWTEKG